MSFPNLKPNERTTETQGNRRMWRIVDEIKFSVAAAFSPPHQRRANWRDPIWVACGKTKRIPFNGNRSSECYAWSRGRGLLGFCWVFNKLSINCPMGSAHPKTRCRLHAEAGGAEANRAHRFRIYSSEQVTGSLPDSFIERMTKALKECVNKSDQSLRCLFKLLGLSIRVGFWIKNQELFSF